MSRRDKAMEVGVKEKYTVIKGRAMEVGVKENYHIFVSKGQGNGGRSLRRITFISKGQGNGGNS